VITLILRTASFALLASAIKWTGDHLHVPEEEITPTVAVAYVNNHFHVGDYEGWDGFESYMEANS